jgi:hypothetical protein
MNEERIRLWLWQTEHIPLKATSYMHKIKLVVSLPFICSNIPAAPSYGVYISQLIRYYRACASYHGFLHIGLQLTLKQGFPVVKLKIVRATPWLPLKYLTVNWFHRKWHLSCYSYYKSGDKSWMRKGPDCDYDKRNTFLVTCDIDTPLNKSGVIKLCYT